MGCIIPGIFIFVVLYAFTISPGMGILSIVGLVVLGIIAVALSSKVDKALDEKLQEVRNELQITFDDKNFNPSQEMFSADSKSFIALDESSKRLCFVKTKNINLLDKTGFDISFINYKDILESHIIEDGVSVNKTSRTSQIGGALLGGVLAGGVGAIIGGLSGSTTTQKEVKNISLQIIVNDTDNPIKDVNFYNGPKVNKDTAEYKKPFERVQHWQKLISVLIHQADQMDKEEQKNRNNEVPLSVADEIQKLSQLYKDGILTKAEFEAQKEKLLMK